MSTFLSRFLAVVFPVSSLTLRTASNAKHLILATWVIVLASSVPIWMTHNILQIDNGKNYFYLSRLYLLQFSRQDRKFTRV